MTSTTFVNKQPPYVEAAWLNDVNNFVYGGAIPPPVGGTTIGLVTNTIALLRATSKLLASRVFVLGYYAQGDGGGGEYWYDSTDVTSTDNGGTVIIAADGGRWKLSWQGSISVKQFGAKGDGVTNDTAAINQALQATLPFASTVPRRVYFPDGNYLVTSALYLRAGCEIFGAGFTATKITSTGFAGINPVVRMGYGLIAGVPTSDASGLVPCVSNIYFSGTGCALDTLGQSGFEVRDCWFNNILGVNMAGSDGSITGSMFDTSCTTGIQVTGSRNQISGCEFIGGVGSNFGIAFSTPTFTTISQTSIANCLFYGLRQQSVYAFATAIIDDVKFVGCTFSTNYNAGVRTAGQTHFLTQVGVVFKRIEFVGCSFEYALENDIAINGGTGIVSIKSCSFSYTGIVDGGASYALKHSILADQVSGPTYLVRDCDFNLVGGASIRVGGLLTKARISNCHSIGCGTGGTGLAASANEGDKSNIQIRNGAFDTHVSDCSTDSTNLYAAGSFNGLGTTYFTSRHNRSAWTSYDTYAAAAGGTYFGERNNGGFTVAVVASAAALTLPFQGTEMPVFSITGTTNITSIVATGWEGRSVRLIFAGVLTLTDGSNLKIAGNFVTTADDAIALSCFGGNWYETGRAVN